MCTLMTIYTDREEIEGRVTMCTATCISLRRNLVRPSLGAYLRVYSWGIQRNIVIGFPIKRQLKPNLSVTVLNFTHLLLRYSMLLALQMTIYLLELYIYFILVTYKQPHKRSNLKQFVGIYYYYSWFAIHYCGTLTDEYNTSNDNIWLIKYIETTAI